MEEDCKETCHGSFTKSVAFLNSLSLYSFLIFPFTVIFLFFSVWEYILALFFLLSVVFSGIGDILVLFYLFLGGIV